MRDRRAAVRRWVRENEHVVVCAVLGAAMCVWDSWVVIGVWVAWVCGYLQGVARGERDARRRELERALDDLNELLAAIPRPEGVPSEVREPLESLRRALDVEAIHVRTLLEEAR